MHPEDRFSLSAAPLSPNARHTARVREEREVADRLARRESDYDAWRRRAFLVTHGPELVDTHDPVEGATLASVLQTLAARVEGARKGKTAAERWWRKTFAVWRNDQLLGIVRPDGEGHPAVDVFESNKAAEREGEISRPACSCLRRS